MSKNTILVALFLGVFHFSFAQESTIDTVFIVDPQMERIEKFRSFDALSKEEVLKNSTNLSEVLRFQSFIYIKENGRGAVSSPSFRGTTAGQTAFVWNGITINSQFLGQSDVNTVGFLAADQIRIKPGGGSVVYGSGAIGGTVHLHTVLPFNKGFGSNWYSEMGSFSSYTNSMNSSFSNEKLSVRFSGSYQISENDYEVKDQDYIHRNGKYYSTQFNLAAAYKIAPYQKLSWLTEWYNATQYFPIFSENTTRTQYDSQNMRSLISWSLDKSNLTNTLIAAYIEENFQYYGNINQPKTNAGKGQNYIVKNDFNYFFDPKWNLNIIGEFQVNEGKGYQSGIDRISRNVGSVAGLLRFFPTEKLNLEAGAKYNFVEGFSSPLLFSFDAKYELNNWYTLGLGFSKNFRFGSFNDLYWQPGGNPALRPETSLQGELRNSFRFSEIQISVVAYYMRIDDMIRWLPTSAGYWAAFNTNQVESYGIENTLEYQKKWNRNEFRAKVGYGYTRSVNRETGFQLMYVPLHKVFGTIDYRFRNIGLFLQGTYNGLTYSDSEENRRDALDPYVVMNAGADLTLFRNFKLGFRVNNLFNQVYETVAFYPMPMRNYAVHLNINL